MIEGVVLTPLKIISGDSGDVLHAMKQTEPSFHGFGEAYFSTINQGAIKAWKRHHKMTLNLVVPSGEIKFVLFDERSDSPTYGEINEFTLSLQNYQRLTVPPMVWLGFKGSGKGLNMLLNVSNIPHDPDEYDRIDAYKNHIDFQWNQDST
ncbi:MAG: dTDP-4-dehydrorhamnose 3,5-epimerase [ANME-2 cluster archaeon]|jgi:dTDP-4-dehydrorhamnose 3,5-epimerase|nr:MAG: dTDP-4-dehydrorhamnose 3,5-epimerase [ANME-2 cluster archaeon]